MRKIAASVLVLGLLLIQNPAQAQVYKAAKVSITKIVTRHDPETGWYVYARFYIAGIKAKQDYRCSLTAYDKSKKVIKKWTTSGSSFDPRPFTEYEALTNIKPNQVKLVKSVTATCSLANKIATGQVLPPIMIDPALIPAISVPLTNVLVFTVTTPEDWSAVVADPTIATFIPGGNQGTYTTNPALKPLKVGMTIVHMTQAGGMTYDIAVTITG